MKLTNQHIQDLYKFTRQHYVEYYDVQTELVDHLANDIEQVWVEKPNLTFEEARDISFKKFGVFGFMDVIEQKQKAMSKKYTKILLGFVKEWFRLPKIIITFGSVFILYTLFSSQFGEYIVYAVLIPFFIFISVQFYKLKKASKQRKKHPDKKWLLEEMIFTTTGANIPIILPQILNIHLYDEYIVSFWGAILFSMLFVIAFLVSYITLTVIPEKGEELLEETYPEYKLS